MGTVLNVGYPNNAVVPAKPPADLDQLTRLARALDDLGASGTRTFLVTDRCDRCTGPAQARVVLINGELQFCLRHFRVHRAVLETITLAPPTFAH